VSETNPVVKALALERERARRDKMFLATEILGYDFQPDVHSELFDLYIPFNNKKAWREQSPIKDRMVLWPRGHFKSTSIIVEAIQAVINFPDVRIVLMQGSIAVTQNLLHEIKSHFVGASPRSRFRQVFPEFCDDKLGTVNKFTTPARVQKHLQQDTFTVASPKAITTGQHYDIGFFDDLVNAQNYQSAKKLQKVKDEFRGFIPLIDPGGYRVVTGTRYAFGDLYEDIIRFNTNGQWTITVKDCWTDDQSGVRFPQRALSDGRIIGFTREGLLLIQREDPAMFSAQYLNKPSTGSTHLFTEEKMLACVIAGGDAPALTPSVLVVDLASSTSQGADDSVILCGRTDSMANIFVCDGIGGQWTPAQLAIHIVEMSLKHRPIRVLIEKTASSTYFVEYLRTVCRDKNIILPIDFIPVSNAKDAKEIRISALEGHVRNKRLKFFAGLPCWEKMLQEFVEFPRGRRGHDDYPDTVSLLVQAFSKNLLPIRTSSKHPLLAAMEQLEAQAATLFTQIGQHTTIAHDSLGAEFET
jgi:predicted phage terminase large subunit-like protein